MKNTNIQWTDHTWNIAVGCRKVDADCKYCYMYRGSLKATRYDPQTVRRTAPKTFNLPLRIKEPSKIFVSSLTDVFLEEIDSYRAEMWAIIKQCPQHTFQILTKRPQRIKQCLPPDWGTGYPNVWIGTSIGHQQSIYRVADLFMETYTYHIKTFLSLEPLHEPVTIKPELLRLFNWVIIGGESGNENGQYKYRPCQLEWIENLVNDCKAIGTAVFVKQLGTHLAKELKLKDRHGGDITEWSEHLQIREFPL